MTTLINTCLLLILSVISIQFLTVTPLFVTAQKQIKGKNVKTCTEESIATKIAFNLLIISTIYFVTALLGLTGFDSGVIACLYLLINFAIVLMQQKKLHFFFRNQVR